MNTYFEYKCKTRHIFEDFVLIGTDSERVASKKYYKNETINVTVMMNDLFVMHFFKSI